MSASYENRLMFPELDLARGESDFSCHIGSLLVLYEKQSESGSGLTQRLLDVGRGVREMGKTWTKGDVEEVGRWAHAQQATAKMKKEAPDLESRIARAFEIQDEESRIEALCRVPGMGPVLASSLLTLTFPNKYGPLEIHAWNSLTQLGFDLPSKPTSGGGFTNSEFLRYLKIIRDLARARNLTPWDIAKALHALDKTLRSRKWGQEFSRLKSIS